MRNLSEEAYFFIKKGENKKKIWNKFAGDKYYRERAPFTYFMAGAPGSGKTEIVRNYLADLFKNCIIADADEIRNLLPQYNGKNSHQMQRAASKGVDILYDGALKYGYNIIVDGTFALKYKKCEENIQRSLNKNRAIIIFYVFANPSVAWMYAKKREYTEGRKISAYAFIRSFFKARENVNKIKHKFGQRVYVVGLKSNYKEGLSKIKVDIKNVDEIQKVGYTCKSLFLKVMYANILLTKERLLWSIKRLIKK
jgi:UDP-N-acetylglucosamine kinase